MRGRWEVGWEVGGGRGVGGGRWEVRGRWEVAAGGGEEEMARGEVGFGSVWCGSKFFGSVR